MKKRIAQLFLMTAVILLITAAAAVSGLKLTDPADTLSHKILPLNISSETQYIELENIEQNTSLILTTQQNPQDIPTIPPEKPEPAENMKLPEVDVLQEKPEEPEQMEEPENPKEPDEAECSETPENQFEQNFEDRPEDAVVQETIQLQSLMDEIGLDSQDQIIYVKNITTGDTMQMENGAYAALLSTKGTTIIQIRYQEPDGSVQTYIKKINYVRPEGSTPAEKQPLINTNIKDQGVYNQPILNFDVWITDYRGKSLGYSDMEVLVNGVPADYIGEMGRQTYKTELNVGSNTITIKVTDEYQYTVTKMYTVFFKSGAGEITISLEASTVGIAYLVEPRKLKVESGVSLSYALDQFLKEEGFTYSYNGNMDDGFYLSRIEKKNMLDGFSIPADLAAMIVKDELMFDPNSYEGLDMLGEFDFSQGSGWMYSINGLYSSYGFNKAYVQDGDEVRIRFTLAYGKDIGGFQAANMAYGKLEDYGKEW